MIKFEKKYLIKKTFLFMKITKVMYIRKNFCNKIFKFYRELIFKG